MMDNISGKAWKQERHQKILASEFKLHIMLAAVTSYAVGLAYVYEEGSAPESELVALVDMLMREYTV